MCLGFHCYHVNLTLKIMHHCYEIITEREVLSQDEVKQTDAKNKINDYCLI
jgi:hypothetical protein